jgi:hypothetical protein
MTAAIPSRFFAYFQAEKKGIAEFRNDGEIRCDFE